MEVDQYEKLLNIKTCGVQKLYYESIHYNRYEATSYDALEEFFKKYKVDKNDHIVDFGCGKGRLNFYINYFFDCNVTGIEVSSSLYQEAIENKINYLNDHKDKEDKISFINSYAEQYKIKKSENKFYFFNPFSVEIFIKTIGNILDSLGEYERPIEIIIYYPSEEYIYYLENFTFFVLKEEITFDYMYEYDKREVFSVYEVSYIKNKKHL